MARLSTQGRFCAALLCAAFAGCAALLTGCASPGLPKPPSLALPVPASDLEASRERDMVTLHFTEPMRTMDKLAIKSPITVALCRQQDAGPCTEVARRAIPPASRKDTVITVTDALPPALTSGQPIVLAYRVTLYNEKGRAADPSNSAYTAGGAAPPSIAGLTVVPAASGALLRWQAEPGTDVIELERDRKPALVSRPAGAPAGASAAAKVPNSLMKPPAEPSQATLRTGSPDAGGTVDAAAHSGETYTYIAWRVRRITIVGHPVELRSAASAPVTVEMRDIFPPRTPQGLIAVPSSGSPGIDLSWELDTELDLAGYIVYRTETAASAAAPTRLNPAPIEPPAFHDSTAKPGVRYSYSVSAIDKTGNESPRSATVEESIE